MLKVVDKHKVAVCSKVYNEFLIPLTENGLSMTLLVTQLQ